MDEAKKTNRVRSAGFRRRYFAGTVIDIGCGTDLVCDDATPFDQAQGDAQRILDYFGPESFDTVHSSHCLEHMADVTAALTQWWALVKPGGHLVLVVPHEDLYEQGAWPSLFNRDHKATFRVGKKGSWSPVSFDIGELVEHLPRANIIEICVQDAGLDHSLLRRRVSAVEQVLFKASASRQKMFNALMRRGLPLYRLGLALERMERYFGKPIDQTLGDALAQIQVVARKDGSVPTMPEPISLVSRNRSLKTLGEGRCA
jgi:SAM-dependent methyltransferase